MRNDIFYVPKTRTLWEIDDREETFWTVEKATDGRLDVYHHGKAFLYPSWVAMA